MALSPFSRALRTSVTFPPLQPQPCTSKTQALKRGHFLVEAYRAQGSEDLQKEDPAYSAAVDLTTEPFVRAGVTKRYFKVHGWLQARL